MEIIGREEEKQELKRLYESERPEFLVVYGRRRVGKTYLIREYFANQFTFYHTGISPNEAKGSKQIQIQIQSFVHSLKEYGLKVDTMPKDWFEAFDLLKQLLIQQKEDNKRLIVFIDELPWMDTPKSNFVSAFEHFWNGWGAGQSNLLLITCGSATAWINDKLMGNKGGLYNRTTYEMYIRPFNLKECESFYEHCGIAMDRYEQVMNYMVMGGIPYYLGYLQKGKSLAQNIDDIFFRKHGKMANEFDHLFNSLFTNHEQCVEIVRVLAKKRKGYTRKEIADLTEIPYGGGLTKNLKALEASEFILPYVAFNGNKREVKYKLIDHYCLFYLNFIDKHKNNSTTFWQDNYDSPTINTWKGYAFEDVCFTHTEQIKQALGIKNVNTAIAPWDYKTADNGAQIDMVIDRADHVINLCELKFTSSPFKIDKDYDTNLRKKVDCFKTDTQCKKSVHVTFITSYGLEQGIYANKVQESIDINALFI